MSINLAPNGVSEQERRTTGQYPSPIPDIPICAVLLVIYLAMAVANLVTLKAGQKQTGQIFIPSGMQIGLCMSRLVSLCLRIAWAKHVGDRDVAIAASIFVLAGVIVLEIVNMILFFRLLVRIHPSLEESVQFRTFKKVVYLFLAPIVLVETVVPGIQSQLVTSAAIRNKDVVALKISIIVQALYCGVPLVGSLYLVAASKIRSGDIFKMWTMVLFNAFWLTFEQCFRTAQSFHREVYWLQSKPTFYCVIFIPEILVVGSNLLRGMQKTFWHPYERATGKTSQSAHLKGGDYPVEKGSTN